MSHDEARANLQAITKKVQTGVKLSGGTAVQSKGDPNNIKVGVRCRPLSKTELGMGEDPIVEFQPPQLCLTNPTPEKGQPENFLFTYDYDIRYETRSGAHASQEMYMIVESEDCRCGGACGCRVAGPRNAW